ncbi:MAG: hypothetical protein LAT84_02490 [Balneolia bacterium]|nr:hypothetical protein [Balneolia bacterium]
MKNLFLSAIPISITLLLISGCGIFNSGDKSPVDIELDLQTLSGEQIITARVVNNTSDVISVYGDIVQTNVQRRSDTGDWHGLASQYIPLNEPINWTDWYTDVDPDDAYEKKITYQQITDFVEIANKRRGPGTDFDLITTEGEYRFFFELYFDHDFVNGERFYSKSFVVE